MYLTTSAKELINLDKVTAISYRRKHDIRAVGEDNDAIETTDKVYEVFAVTDHGEYVIQTVKTLSDAVDIMDLISASIFNNTGNIIRMPEE